MTRIILEIPPVVFEALNLDDPVMLTELRLNVLEGPKGFAKCYRVECLDVTAAYCVLTDVESRSEWQGPEWDQPTNWRIACRRYLPKIAAQLAVPEIKGLCGQNARRIVSECDARKGRRA